MPFFWHVNGAPKKLPRLGTSSLCRLQQTRSWREFSSIVAFPSLRINPTPNLGCFSFYLFRVTHPGESRQLRVRALPQTVEVQPGAGARSPLALAGLWVLPPRSSHGPRSVSAPLSLMSHLVPELCLGAQLVTWVYIELLIKRSYFILNHMNMPFQALRNALGQLPPSRLGSDDQDPPRRRVGTRWPGTAGWLCVGDCQGEGATAAGPGVRLVRTDVEETQPRPDPRGGGPAVAIAVRFTEGPKVSLMPGHAPFPVALSLSPSCFGTENPDPVRPSQLRLPLASVLRRSVPPNPVVCLCPPVHRGTLRHTQLCLRAGSAPGEWWFPNLARPDDGDQLSVGTRDLGPPRLRLT